jgi:hypothetical protein
VRCVARDQHPPIAPAVRRQGVERVDQPPQHLDLVGIDEAGDQPPYGRHLLQLLLGLTGEQHELEAMMAVGLRTTELGPNGVAVEVEIGEVPHQGCLELQVHDEPRLGIVRAGHGDAAFPADDAPAAVTSDQVSRSQAALGRCLRGIRHGRAIPDVHARLVLGHRRDLVPDPHVDGRESGQSLTEGALQIGLIEEAVARELEEGRPPRSECGQQLAARQDELSGHVEDHLVGELAIEIDRLEDPHRLVVDPDGSRQAVRHGFSLEDDDSHAGLPEQVRERQPDRAEPDDDHVGIIRAASRNAGYPVRRISPRIHVRASLTRCAPR